MAASTADAPSPSDLDWSDADLGVMDALKRAEDEYGQALADFKAGDDERARAHVRSAFSELAETVAEDGLAEGLRPDFLSIAEKVRAFDGTDDPVDTPTDLDADPAQLASVSTASVPSVDGHKNGAIEIDPDNETVKRFLALYTEKPARRKAVEEALSRSELYKPMMTAALRKARLPEELFWLVMAESEFKAKAVSRASAAGLWQFMPGTARHYGLEVSYWVDERFDPQKSTLAAVRYLRDLKDWFGTWPLALAAYNRGEGGVGRDLQFTRSTDFSQLAGRGALPAETQSYVPKFMACVLLGEHPERYGLHPAPAAPDPYDVARVDRDLDLGVAAKAAGTDEDTIKRLNPELRAWCTPKGRSFDLRIPKGTHDRFLAALAKVRDWNPGPQLVLHKVRRGEYLGRIAKKYHTTVRVILRHNNIRNPRRLRPGMVLRIPPGRGFSGR
ncbi:MAG: transglycosylase SLT domain-containing protein [Elusimicrobia bacterium]|nr:transglycosylase SLT domain-containing protein [Elusimicrobiota bacterium]